MPLTRISLRQGRSASFKRTVMDEVYTAMRETFDVPEDDRFMVLSEHDASGFVYGRTYLGIERSDDLVIVQITASRTRSTSQKQALYRAIADRLQRFAGVRPEDVFVSLVEATREDWSFGNGEAQYVEAKPPVG
ncbi:MAG: tautomerase family protein [Pseudomonadota bacterium]